MDRLEIKARKFASERHAAVKQKRKYTGEPYIVHPAAVAELVRGCLSCTSEMLAAAWLHDTVEDTGTKIDEIRNEFGDIVAELVEMLTDVSRPSDGNRAVRKEIDRQHLAKASAAAHTIKLADLIDNTRTIVQNDKEFAIVYLSEKRKLLEVLTKGDPFLYEAAKSSLAVSEFMLSNKEI